jgi:ABC-2 type transport system permease protein
MTVTAARQAVPTANDRAGITRFGNLVGSEWTKLTSVRSTIWALLLLVVLSVSFTGLLIGLIAGQWDTITEQQRQVMMVDPVSQILGAGFQFSQLAICVLGVLVVTSEYTTGTIRASMLAVPRRTPVLAAKAVLFAGVTFVVAEVAAFSSFFLGAAILHSHVPVSLTGPGVLRAVIGAGLYISMLGVFAIAVGTLIRHTAAAITGIIGFVLVLAPLTLLLPGNIGKYVYAYLPTNAGQQIATTGHGADTLLSPWQGFGVFALWTAALLTLATYLLQRRDV